MNALTAAPRRLRSYQIEAVDAIERDWADGFSHVGIVLPTGTGKSSVIGETARRGYRRGDPVVGLAHRGELLTQMKTELMAVDPSIPESDIGIVRAEEDDHHCPIVFATMQTLATARRRKALGKRRIVLWDEVHHAGAEGFHTTMTELDGYDQALMAGFTATMSRDERGKIGLGDVIQKISFERDIKWAIKHGYLVMPHGLTVRIKGLDALNDVRNVAGDFHQGQLAEIMEAASTYVVEAIEKHASDRRPIIFAASVDAAHEITRAINDSDFALTAEAVTGEMSYTSRQPIYDRYRSGVTQALVTVMVLTEGADFPMCDAVVLARPTRSRNLYSQMIGRSLRLFPGKSDALVLDLAGSSRNMKLVRLTQLLEGADISDVDRDGNEIEYEDEPEYDDVGAAPDLPTEVKRMGPVDMVTIDLLANDTTLWLETPAGVPFISLMNNDIVFLWPEDGRRPVGDERLKWAVGQINTRRPKIGGWVNETGRYPSPTGEPVYVDLPDALENAEIWIVETEQWLPDRGSSWRRNHPPSEKQLRLGRKLQIVNYADMTKARLSDEISIAYASRVLDGAMEPR